ncbi:hypothetical protein C8F01DRAFT_1027085 [Mycena amicta]|nr:hypothetical protein C8F01DRAFT_1027085 [Mycena amicta]
MPGTWTIADHLDVLRNSLKSSVPYVSGLHPVRAQDLGLYYNTTESDTGKDGVDSVRFIDFSSTGLEAELEQLATACEKATFGADNGDVLDETYRKAGKLELDKFAARLDVHTAGIVDAIAPDLLVGPGAPRRNRYEEDEQVIRAELYKLNVYGPGSFFKGHKDTPRAQNMIGSLVIVLPTEHEGGALTLSQGEGSWTFDSSEHLKAHRTNPANSPPAVAYIAFYSDVTHTVEPVISGYRVTLTYNLFLASRTPSTDSSAAARNIRSPSAPELDCEKAIRELLSNPTWFPTGGIIGFGLTHQYPMPREDEYPSRPVLLDLALLKGCDARLKNSALRAGLRPRVRLVYKVTKYKTPTRYVLLDKVGESSDPDPSGYGESEYRVEESPELQRKIQKDGSLMEMEVEHSDEELDEGWYYRDPRPPVPVLWVTKPTGINSVETEGYFGNDYQENSIYGNGELFVRIPAADDPARNSSMAGSG